jgi:hypothetical protein
MTLDEMYTMMELYGFDDFEDSQKLMLLNDAYLDVVTREPWPFMEKLVTLSVPSGTTQITNNAFSNSPTDVNSVTSFIDVTNNIIMLPERGDTIEKKYQSGNFTNATPSVYYFVGEDMFVYPQTQTATNYRLSYIRTPSSLETDADNLVPTRHHNIIVYGALVKAFLVNDDPQAAVFQNMFESKYQQMRNDLWMNQYDRTDRIQVMTDSYDWSY